MDAGGKAALGFVSLAELADTAVKGETLSLSLFAVGLAVGGLVVVAVGLYFRAEGDR